MDPDTKAVLAGKIVSKALLVKQHQKEKMTQEITIHRELHHKHIVGFSSFFEDSENVYIVLELCRKRVRSSSNCELGRSTTLFGIVFLCFGII